ncbi:MAG: glycerophosphodiester phosphodiesterase family protein, partial [Pseudomonadales bacterium]|nr:glycerophosphodiester phosphodiesterase family protein [Pseudomonadales bacterium]
VAETPKGAQISSKFQRKSRAPKYRKKIRETDMHLSVWTVNNPEQIKALYELKVDSIISDYPSMALPLINSLKRRK